jgi:hypothetical protein
MGREMSTVPVQLVREYNGAELLGWWEIALGFGERSDLLGAPYVRNGSFTDCGGYLPVEIVD